MYGLQQSPWSQTGHTEGLGEGPGEGEGLGEGLEETNCAHFPVKVPGVALKRMLATEMWQPVER